MRRLWCTVAVFVVVASSAGCIGSEASPGAADGVMTLEQYRDAVREDTENYQWPPDYQPDPDKIANRGADSEALFEEGHHEMVLSILNECGWFLSWLDARERGDTKGVDQALDVMTNVIPLDREYISDPDGSARRQREQLLSQAALGDPSLVQSFVTANCEPVYWTTDS